MGIPFPVQKRGNIPVFIISAAILVCLTVIIYGRWHSEDKLSDVVYLSLLHEAYSVVLKKHVEKPDSKKLVRSMVDGMLATLDPHSAYLPPETYHEMEVQMSGTFGGVGIEVGVKDSKLTVIAPIEDTPAFKAGVQANDHIFKIDGFNTRRMNISAAVKLMRGEKGAPVTLTILRNDSLKPLTFKLVRDVIKLKSLKFRALESGYGLIRISQFHERTGIEFRQALQELHASAGGNPKGLLIDLRYNPGGLLESCVEVANSFIGDNIKNSVIVSIKGRSSGTSRVYNASPGAKEPRYPVVVLINGGSASASEIVAGALQDHKRAIIMGKPSFGKGSVQSIFPMEGEAALKLTTALYYTPSGRSIQGKGIIPDIEVDNVQPLQTKEKRMEIREKDLGNRLSPEENQEASRIREVSSTAGGSENQDLQKDYQMKRAMDLLRSLNLVQGMGMLDGR